MTHNYLRDRDYLAAAPTDVGYIAMLGPAARTQRILMDLAEEGVEITDDARPRSTVRPASTRRGRPG
jgi:hypothetical protein